MAEKDTALKLFFSNVNVFTDLCNGYFFEGKKAIDPSRLVPVDTTAMYYFDGNDVKNLDRDVAKQYIDPVSKKVLATIGIENQSKPNSQMAKRVISYDGGNYRGQVDKNLSEGHVVVTLVIDHSKDSDWEPKSLLQSLPKTNDKVVKKLTTYARDYNANYLHLRRMSRKHFMKYGMSDLRLLFEVFYDNIHNENDHQELIEFIKDNKDLKVYCPQILALAIHSLTDSEYYKDMFDVAMKNLEHTEGEPYIMCDILKIYSEQLLQQGEEKGKRIGKESRTKEFIMNMLKYNKSDDEIKTMVPDCTDDLINEVRKELDEE